MLMPRNMMLDVLDPYPLVLKRSMPPEPPSQADVWFEQEFKELREKKLTVLGVWDRPIAKPEQVHDSVFYEPGKWYAGNPPSPGYYTASRDNNSKVRRVWNGRSWSQPTYDYYNSDQRLHAERTPAVDVPSKPILWLCQ